MTPDRPFDKPTGGLADWLALLEQRHPRAIDLGLERIAAVAQRAGIGRPAPRVVTVAGTNGKGSCVAVLAELLCRAGWRVGTYTSPHLVRYNERIVLPEGEAGDADICEAFARIEQARGDISLTYFEFGTLAAFDLMARANCDVAVLEVGLGGRLDAVNLLDADVAVITSIDLDHQDWLGDNRDQIGVEKAGIARAGRPVLVADADPPPAMLAALDEMGAETLLLGEDFGPPDAPGAGLPPAGDTLELRLLDPSRATTHLILTRIPALPLPSVICAVQAALLLDSDGLIRDALQAGLPPVLLPGRWQRLMWRDREVILDVAHNPAAATLLAARLGEEPGRRNIGVCSIMADKNIAAILQPLAPLMMSLAVTDLRAAPRAASATVLAAAARDEGIVTTEHSTPEEAFDRAIASAEPGDRVVVFGSFFIVGPLLQHIRLRERGAVPDDSGVPGNLRGERQ